jgi:hypothetical protein
VDVSDADVAPAGFDTLVLQWTQYGDAFADENGRFLLRQRAEHARAPG